MRIKHDLLLRLRRERGWSQEDAAAAISGGIDVRTYRRYERGEVALGNRADQYHLLDAIAAAFGLTGPDALLDPLPSGPGSEGGKDVARESTGRSAAQIPSHPKPLRLPGGPYHPAVYVHRDREEKEARRRLLGAGAPTVLQAPELHGKATLLEHLLSLPDLLGGGDSPRVCRIDLTTVDVKSLASVLHDVGERLVGSLRPAQAAELLSRTAKRPGTPQSQLTWLVRHLLDETPIVLALEKAEWLLACVFHPAFFAMLRGWAEAGDQAPWSSLRLLLTVSSEPMLLESIDHSSFFALASPICLQKFNLAQAEELARRYDVAYSAEELRRLFERVGGHPYLLALAFYQAAIKELPLGRVLVEDSGAGGIFAGHLLLLRRYLEHHELLPALGAVLRDPTAPLRFADYCKLYGKGLLIERKVGEYEVQSPLYADYLRELFRR